MRRFGRVIAALAAFGFGYIVFLYLTLPDVRVLRTGNIEPTAFMQLRAREARAEGRQLRHVQQWVPYSRISPHLKRAVLVAEDAGFWGHEGIDIVEIKKALESDWERGGLMRGASTITQQLAKNLYLSPSYSPQRKLVELMIARRLEAELSKQRILELYLNLIEWGNGIYGAEAAARTYFGKSAADLGPQESALLAGAISSPRAFDPARPSARLRRRQEMILRRMGAVTPPPVLAEPLAPSAPGTEDIPVASPSIEAPVVLPGEIVPPSKPPGPPGAKPPGGGTRP
jgi:monofunctional biosynthetic peptidoglycan transglycosylase